MKEIYNEHLRDLLAEKEPEEELKILNGERGMYVPGLTLLEVQTEDDVINAMKRGNSNRSVGRTNMNEHSSRSHSLLSVEVEGENIVAGIKYYGKLHLIDLAGSERLAKSQATGDRLKEAQAINKSLSALGNVIEALQKKQQHIPYRNSKLTYLLQDSLGGHAKTLMFINVSPTAYDSDETNQSLMFATRVGKVELGQATKNTAPSNAPKDKGEAVIDEKAPPATPTSASAAAKKTTAASSSVARPPSSASTARSAGTTAKSATASAAPPKTPVSAKKAISSTPKAGAKK